MYGMLCTREISLVTHFFSGKCYISQIPKRERRGCLVHSNYMISCEKVKINNLVGSVERKRSDIWI